MLIEHEFPADGDYTFTVKGMTGYFTAVLGNVKGEKLEVTVDGERVYLYDWDKEIGTERGNGGRTPEIPIKAGFHRVGVTFIATSDLPDTGLNRSFVRTMNSPGSISGYTFYPHVGQVFIEGPFNGAVATEHAEPRQDLRVLPRGEQRGSRVRAHDHHRAGQQGLPPSGQRGRHRRDDGLLRSRT